MRTQAAEGAAGRGTIVAPQTRPNCQLNGVPSEDFLATEPDASAIPRRGRLKFEPRNFSSPAIACKKGEYRACLSRAGQDYRGTNALTYSQRLALPGLPSD
jgi:hypothetical protein